jgi:predicted GIY-YIG superfamily endonuclease
MTAYGPRRSTLERRVRELESLLAGSRMAAKQEAAEMVAQIVARKHADRLPATGNFVYIIWGDDERPLYIGQTAHLLQRLGWHYRNHRTKLKSVQLLECESRKAALWLEDVLIRVMRPLYNALWTTDLGQPTARRRPPRKAALVEDGWTSEPSDEAA